MTSPLLPLLWVPLLAIPFLEPNIYADGLSRDLAVLATALFAAAIFQLASDKASPKPNNTVYPWLFLLLLLLPSAVLLTDQAAQAPWFVWRQSLYFTATWLVFMMMRQHPSRWFASQHWAIVLTITAHLYIIYALLEVYLPHLSTTTGTLLFWSNKIAHFPGPLRQQNQQALFLVIVITLIWQHSKAKQQQLYWEIASLLPIAGVLLTASRSGLIVLLLAALLVGIFSRFQTRTLWVIARTLALGGLLSLAISATTPTGDTEGVIAHIQHTMTDDTPSIRMMVWSIALHLWLQHPWLGIGWGNFAAHLFDAAAPVMALHPEFIPIASHLGGGVTQAHNVLLHFLVEGGIVAGSALMLLFAGLIRQAKQWWQQPPPPNSGATNGWICAIVILTHGMVSVAIMEPFFMVLLALSLAACFADDHHRS